MATLREIINYSKANPNTDYAKGAWAALQRGEFDEAAQKEGIDLGPVGRPSFKPLEQPTVSQETSKSTGTKVAEAVGNFTGGTKIAQGIGQGLAQNANNKDIQATQKNQVDMVDLILKHVKQYRDEGKPVPPELHDVLRRMTGLLADTGNDASKILNPNDLTTKQVAGDALQLATTAGAGKVAGAVAGEATGATGVLRGVYQGAKTGLKAGAAVGALTGVSQGLKNDESALDIAKSGVTGTLEGAATGGILGGVTGGISGGIKQYKVNKSFFPLKTQESILATPEDKLYKLSAPERKFYFDHHSELISQKSAAAEAQVKADLEKSTIASQSQAEDLQRQLNVASRDEVIKLRPKIVKAMGEQSNTYRRLVSEEMAGKENIPVQVEDLKSHIDSKYGDNPALANAVKDKLGLNEAPTTLKKGELPSIQTEGKTTTLGDLFNKTKALRQDISSGAAKGSKVFTPEDKLTDDTINTLTDFMKKNGVDFKAANQFWSKYAPIRNQLVSEAKPFLQTGTQTKTFANTLTRVAKGTDVNNENFINEVENLIGEPVGVDSKKVLSQLSANEKQAAAKEMETQLQKADIKLNKEKELKRLSDTQFKAEQKAYRRKIIRNIILGTTSGSGALGIGKKVTNAAGLGK